jgi:hypothetical protein
LLFERVSGRQLVARAQHFHKRPKIRVVDQNERVTSWSQIS